MFSYIAFSIVMVDRCATTIISTPVISNKQYTLYNTPLKFSFTPFTESVGYCGTFMYMVVPIDTQLVTFNEPALSFSIYTTNVTKVGTQQISVTGILPGVG
jgi:hypothetical protein